MADATQLLNLIPAEPEYNPLRWAIQRVAETFPDRLGQISVDRLAGWIREIGVDAAGNRDADQIRDDIFAYIVTAPVIMQRLGVDEETAQQLILGSNEGGIDFSSIEIPPAGDGGDGGDGSGDDLPEYTEQIDDTVIPAGGVLVRVANPRGSDSPFQYFIEYTTRGVTLSYEIGGETDFNERFPSGMSAFGRVVTYDSQAGFDDATDYRIEMGLADPLYGATESLESQIERELHLLGMEDLPPWIASDPQAMMILMEGTLKGFSAGNIWGQLSDTDAFKGRFGGGFADTGALSVIREQMGGETTIQAAVEEYLFREKQIQADLRRYRGPGADVSADYVGSLIASGWTTGEIGEVLKGEYYLRQTPEAFDNLNEILAYQGMNPLTETEFIQIVSGNAPGATIAAVNDAIRFTELERQGIDITPELADLLGDDEELAALDPDAIGEIAQVAAQNIFRYNLELEAGKFGITRDQIIAAAFGEEGAAETSLLLAKFARERQRAAQGYAGVSAYQDEEGRLRVQGFAGL